MNQAQQTRESNVTISNSENDNYTERFSQDIKEGSAEYPREGQTLADNTKTNLIETSQEDVLNDSSEAIITNLYTYRFAVLALFSFCTMFSALAWIQFAPLFSLMEDVSLL